MRRYQKGTEISSYVCDDSVSVVEAKKYIKELPDLVYIPIRNAFLNAELGNE